MKIIIGLGNPGAEYAGTRHNAGMMLADKIYGLRFKDDEYGFRRHKNIMIYESKDLVLVKTAGVFMNESGRMIYDLRYKNYDMKNLYIAHDDLDIALGQYKIQFGVGPREHNGVNSVTAAMGTDQYWHVRIGVDGRDEAMRARLSGEEYVLQKFTGEEKDILDQVLNDISHKL